MSIQGIPGANQALADFVNLVRGYSRDFPELNRLVKGEESTDRQIAWATLDAVSDFNGTPPFTTVTLADLLNLRQHSLLLRMTIISLYESIGILQTRNHVNCSDGGINAGLNDKTPMIMNWLQYFKSTSEQMKQRVKISMNINSILNDGQSGVHSELYAVNSMYAAY